MNSKKAFKQAKEDIAKVKESIKATREEIKRFGSKLNRAERELALLDEMDKEKVTNEEMHRRVQEYRHIEGKDFPSAEAREDYNKNMELLEQTTARINANKVRHEQIKNDMKNNIVNDDNIKEITDIQNSLAADLGRETALIYRSNASAVVFWHAIMKTFPEAKAKATDDYTATLN